MIRHYLDHNATTPARPEVIEAVSGWMAHIGNASSVHREGRAAHGVVETARESLADALQAPAAGVVFTGSGTEAIHLALHGATRAHGVKRLFISAIEHTAVLDNARGAGLEVEIIPVQPTGVVDLDWLKDRLADYDPKKDGAFLVAMMLANNETGVIQPVADIVDLAHGAGGLVFCDAAQGVGKIPVHFEQLGVDMMSLAAHKFGGPMGVGALLLRNGLSLEPVLRGGGQELRRRAGTINVPCVAGLGVAARLLPDTIARVEKRANLRNDIERAVVQSGARIWGADSKRLPGTVSFSVDGFPAETQLMLLDLTGIAVSSGAACSSGKAEPSHVLTAMGATEDEAQSSIRVSLGWSSTKADAVAFIREWTAACKRIKAKAA
ncbi:MAG: cysteine desulfurase family protein [Pseudomonadota bacterium]